ncbi:hypothetical protein ABMC13_15675, partial [Citrobacter portucalensis]
KACVLPENPASYRVVRKKSYLFNKALILYPWQASDDYFSGYITADKAPTDCQYYFNNDASNFSRHTAFIDKNPGLCQSHKFIYITTYPESKKLSVLVCRSPIKARQENACQSVYYPRYDS